MKKYIKSSSWIKDCIDKYRVLLALFISVVLGYLYFKGNLRSVRFSVSDAIAVASIILGILGVFIGLLTSVRADSFFTKLSEYGNNSSVNAQVIFSRLMTRLRNNFALNLLFIILALAIDVLPITKNLLLKAIFFGGLSLLFFLSVWGVWYLVDLVVSIMLFKPEKSSRKTTT